MHALVLSLLGKRIIIMDVSSLGIVIFLVYDITLLSLKNSKVYAKIDMMQYLLYLKIASRKLH